VLLLCLCHVSLKSRSLTCDEDAQQPSRVAAGGGFTAEGSLFVGEDRGMVSGSRTTPVVGAVVMVVASSGGSDSRGKTFMECDLGCHAKRVPLV